MKINLSITSRILVAFASGALIVVFFLPAWRIDLFAPQYPEGLTMNIWVNGLSGDVEIINGLNHYIGMKPITEAMFPEFKFLPYVVGFFMLLGMVVAITGNRKFLFTYLVLTAIGGFLALYDFYRWGKDFGSDLDPTAPIQVPGFSYRPPLLGHKRLLNFDAYSFPDVGGMIVIAAGALAFSVWFIEWYRKYKIKKKARAAQVAVPLVALSLLLASCNAKPDPFNYGKDNCHLCKMTIMDPKYGCEVITKKSKVYKFDDLICIANFLKSGAVEEKEIARKVVINFEKENDFIDVEKSVFWQSPELRSPMGSNAAAFKDKSAAEKAKGEKPGSLLTWNELFSKM